MADSELAYELGFEDGKVRMVIETVDIRTDFYMSPDDAIALAFDLQETAEQAIRH